MRSPVVIFKMFAFGLLLAERALLDCVSGFHDRSLAHTHIQFKSYLVCFWKLCIINAFGIIMCVRRRWLGRFALGAYPL